LVYSIPAGREIYKMVYSQPAGRSIHKEDLQLTCRQMDTLVLSDRLTAGRWYTSMVYSLPAGR
jgi:hypothetical protein